MASPQMLRAIFHTALTLKEMTKEHYQELVEKEQMFVNGLQYPTTNRAMNIDDYYYSTNMKIDWNMEIVEPTTLREEMLMTHDQYVVWLKRKYDFPTCNYYIDNQCTIKNQKIERLNEGLFLHHLAEECRMSYTNILTHKFGLARPHDLYDPNNFIYCNYLEHLLLHIKIMIEDLTEPEGYGTDIAGTRNIWRELNGFYENGQMILPNKKAAELIANRYDDYIFIIKCLLDMIVNEPRCARLINLQELCQDKNGIIMKKIKQDVMEGKEV